MHCLVLLSALLACVAGVPLNNTNPKLEGRIFGGTTTYITSHPYQVSITYQGGYWCSASIISAYWVVAKPFCFQRPDPYRLALRSGSTYFSSGGTDHIITTVIIHESYDGTDYDVAVAQVSPAFIFSASVQPITLECDPVPARTDVVLTGWGEPMAPDGPLQQVTLTTVTDSSCKYFFGESITDRMMCTGDINGGKGACTDFGAPLVKNNKLVGILSRGYSCGNPIPPDVYTKVSSVCEWIVINAGLYEVSAVINWIKPIPGFPKMPLTFIATYPNN